MPWARSPVERRPDVLPGLALEGQRGELDHRLLGHLEHLPGEVPGDRGRLGGDGEQARHEPGRLHPVGEAAQETGRDAPVSPPRGRTARSPPRRARDTPHSRARPSPRPAGTTGSRARWSSTPAGWGCPASPGGLAPVGARPRSGRRAGSPRRAEPDGARGWRRPRRPATRIASCVSANASMYVSTGQPGSDRTARTTARTRRATRDQTVTNMATRQARRRPLRSPAATSSHSTAKTGPEANTASVSGMPVASGPPAWTRGATSAASPDTTKLPAASSRYSRLVSLGRAEPGAAAHPGPHEARSQGETGGHREEVLEVPEDAHVHEGHDDVRHQHDPRPPAPGRGQGGGRGARRAQRPGREPDVTREGRLVGPEPSVSGDDRQERCRAQHPGELGDDRRAGRPPRPHPVLRETAEQHEAAQGGHVLLRCLGEQDAGRGRPPAALGERGQPVGDGVQQRLTPQRPPQGRGGHARQQRQDGDGQREGDLLAKGAGDLRDAEHVASPYGPSDPVGP